jgi:hypothetical protein
MKSEAADAKAPGSGKNPFDNLSKGSRPAEAPGAGAGAAPGGNVPAVEVPSDDRATGVRKKADANGKGDGDGKDGQEAAARYKGKDDREKNVKEKNVKEKNVEEKTGKEKNAKEKVGASSGPASGTRDATLVPKSTVRPAGEAAPVAPYDEGKSSGGRGSFGGPPSGRAGGGPVTGSGGSSGKPAAGPAAAAPGEPTPQGLAEGMPRQVRAIFIVQVMPTPAGPAAAVKAGTSGTSQPAARQEKK